MSQIWLRSQSVSRSRICVGLCQLCLDSLECVLIF
jgi:hypothetical protein